MKLNLKNLGAIKDGTIDLSKRINILCGQNNTGKTYLAFVIYALTREKFSRSPLKFELASLIENGEVTINTDAKTLYDYLIDSLSDIKSNLDTIFGISEEVAQKMFKDFELNLMITETEFNQKYIELNFKEQIQIGEYRFNFKKNTDTPTVIIGLIDGIDYSEILNDHLILIKLTSILINRIVLFPITKSVIFTVERNSIFTFSKELSINRNLLIDQMQKLNNGEKLDPFELLQGGSNRYPIAIKDGLTISDDLTAWSNKKSVYYDFAIEIEQKLLNGTLEVNKKSGALEFVSNKNKNLKLPIHMSASIVKTLSSVIFYLKYSAEKNDLIIIDEPEMNLHPDNQIILTKVFAKLYNKGFRLFISTHSDYVVREINNLIMASSLNENSNAELKNIYSSDEIIKPNDVNVNYFNFIKSNATQLSIKKIEVTTTGFEVESIDNEINAQNERAMDLFYEINKEY